MKDVNKPLREAIFPALKLTGEGVYYMQAPDNLRGNYIVYTVTNVTPVINNTDSIAIVNTQISICTEGIQYNSGDSADVIAAKVFQRIYPSTSYVLNLGVDFQMISTELVSDTTNSFDVKDQIVAIDRTIIFQHKIFVR